MKKLFLLLLPILFCTNTKAQNWILVADTSFGVMGPNNFDLYTLDPTKNYKLTISGVFSEGGGGWYDVHYTYIPTITDFGYNFFITSPAWLVNLPATPSGYDSTHIYNYYFPGDGSIIHFSFSDNGYTDNGGMMYFDLYEECPVANHPISSDTSICVNQGILLIANNANNYTWYDSPTGGNILSTDDSLQVGALLQTDTFYVSTIHYVGCESNRDTVIVIANPLPVVTFNLPSTNDTTCIADGIFLITGESPAGGVFSGPGVNGNMFDPSVAGTGTHVINYFYTDINGCDNSASQQIYVDVCAGISVSNLSSVNRIIPNPNNGIFQLEFPQGTENAIVQISNVMGEIVYDENISRENNSINMSTSATGIYIIKIESNNQMEILKFIKQ